MISKITLCITLLSIVAENTIFADDIKKISPCIAELNNGKRIDLTSIANEKTFRWKKKALNPPGDTHWYYYNPCNPFNLGGSCPNNAACQSTDDEKTNYDLGRQDDTIEFQYGDSTAAILYTSKEQDRKTVVVCFCTPNSKVPAFQVQGSQFKDGFSIYYMTLNSTCCCPGGCTSSSHRLSNGSIFVICVIFCYIIFGILFSFYRSKSIDMPNADFWKEQPSNIKTGIFYVLERIGFKNTYFRV